jgi:hypothetical protein
MEKNKSSNEELIMEFIRELHNWSVTTQTDPPDDLVSRYEVMWKKKLTKNIPMLYMLLYGYNKDILNDIWELHYAMTKNELHAVINRSICG